MAVLLPAATYRTLGGAPGSSPVVVPGVISQLAVNNASGQLLAQIGGTRRWAWFQAQPAQQTMQWGLIQQAHVQSAFSLLSNDPGGSGTTRERRAYYLPYRQNGLTYIKLRNNADFCFTAPLGGCTIYVHRPAGAAPQLYHANAGSVAAGQKQNYMDFMFRAASGVQANHASVSVFRSEPLMTLNVHPGLTWYDLRKHLMLRHNLEWTIVGANVMGRRVGNNSWTFYWQSARLVEYDRFALIENLRALVTDGARRLHVTKNTSLRPHASGLL